MSLETLRHMRRAGERPNGIVKVLIGRRHPEIHDAPDVIAIAHPDQPRLMDWRAVVGLPVMLFVCDDASDLGEQVLDAVKAAGAKLLGAAWRDATIAPEPAQPALRRMWEVLCLS